MEETRESSMHIIGTCFVATMVLHLGNGSCKANTLISSSHGQSALCGYHPNSADGQAGRFSEVPMQVRILPLAIDN